MSRIAVVTAARGRHRQLLGQHRSLARGSRRPDHYLVVAVGDPDIESSTVDGLDRQAIRHPGHPDGLPLAAALNRGFKFAVECGADILVGLGVDVLAGTTLVSGYVEAVAAHPDRLWSGPVTRLPPTPTGDYALAELARLDAPPPAGPVPGQWNMEVDPMTFSALSFALSADLWRRLGGFHEAYRDGGAEGADLARQAERLDTALASTGTARGYRQHGADRSAEERVAAIVRDATIFRRRWGLWPDPETLADLARRGLIRRQGTMWALNESDAPRAEGSREAPPSGSRDTSGPTGGGGDDVTVVG